MLSFNITDFAWLMVALGFASWSFAKRDVMRNAGTMLMGFGMLFIGMWQMGEAAHPLRTHEYLDRIVAMDDDVDHLHAEILSYITALAREKLNTADTKRIEDEI